VSGTVKEELIVCTIAILLVMGLLLGADRDPVIPAGVRAFRPRREVVPPARLHQDLRPDRRIAAVDHAGTGLDPDLLFLRGRIKSDDENWLVRTMIDIFKPMLSWLMDRTTLVCRLFAIILGLGYAASTKLGREFMPALNEQSIIGSSRFAILASAHTILARSTASCTILSMTST